MIGELTELGGDAGTLGVGDDHLGAGVLDRPYRRGDVPVPRAEYRNVVCAALRQSDQVEDDQRIHALLVLLGAEGEVALELGQFDTARLDRLLDRVLPSRIALLEVAEPDLDTRGRRYCVEVPALRSIAGSRGS